MTNENLQKLYAHYKKIGREDLAEDITKCTNFVKPEEPEEPKEPTPTTASKSKKEK